MMMMALKMMMMVLKMMMMMALKMMMMALVNGDDVDDGNSNVEDDIGGDNDENDDTDNDGFSSPSY